MYLNVRKPNTDPRETDMNTPEPKPPTEFQLQEAATKMVLERQMYRQSCQDWTRVRKAYIEGYPKGISPKGISRRNALRHIAKLLRETFERHGVQP